MKTNIADQLLQIKQGLEKAKAKRDLLTGRQMELTNQLKALGCSTIEEGEEEIDSLRKKLTSTTKQLQDGMQAFCSKYKFGESEE